MNTTTRTGRRRAVAALAAIAAGGLGAAVAAQSGGAASGDAEVVVFDPRSDVLETFVELGDDGFSAGDIIVERSGLVDPEGGDSVGRAVTRVNVVEARVAPSDDDPVGDFLFYLDCTVELAGGNLTFQGSAEHRELPNGMTFSVTGGTGSYAGASGTVTVKGAEIDGQAGATLTFDLAA